MDLAVHRNTPQITAIDGRGLQVRQIQYLCRVAGGTIEELITRHHHDAAGRSAEHWDPRLYGARAKPNLTTLHSLTGRPLLVDSVDSGWRVNMPGMAGQVLLRWDQSGNTWCTTYDPLMRVISIETNAHPAVELLTYGAADADCENNRRGRLLCKVDSAGSVSYDAFSLNAMPLQETRTLLDGAIYTTHWGYGADGVPLIQRDAGQHEQYSHYDVMGQLQRLTLKIGNDDAPVDILKQANYDAEGRCVEQQLGNGVIRNWFYDPANNRMKRLTSGVTGQALRQDLSYEYDCTGNVVNLLDQTFNARSFSNQRIDGRRNFDYDSLYRLIKATGHDAPPLNDAPGRPMPGRSDNLLTYTQSYEYDLGGNLTKLVHQRAIGCYTHQTFIDRGSNRGVRWKEGDPAPDFSEYFDRHGNLRILQPGRRLQWNAYDELASITLVERESGLHDREMYCYSGGSRILKRHETYTSTTLHHHEVRYLPGLEIRTRDTGEKLHVITLPDLIGNVRCLHWLQKRPDEIAQDQIRYCLDDNQNSSLVELDQAARLISHEEYYPFGGTALLTATSELEVSYKTHRYSGKELDESGFYYYGRRYYAPWSQRWVSADPAGAVDGWNLYAMVGNNPMSHVDVDGLGRDKSSGDLSDRMKTRTNQILKPPSMIDGSREDRARFIRLNEDAKLTQELRDYSLVGHAGVAVHLPGPGHESTVMLTDFFNIPREMGYSKYGNLFLVTPTTAVQGIIVSRGRNPALDRSHPLSAGVLTVTDPEKFIAHLNNRYIERFNDSAYPVRIYQGQNSAHLSLAGLEHEVEPIHPIIQRNILRHIAASENDLPYLAGFPGTHAEVQGGSFGLYMQKNLTGSVDPARIEIVTHRLQNARAAIAFPACFNCMGTLVATYDGAVQPFHLSTGVTPMNHEEWRTLKNASTSGAK